MGSQGYAGRRGKRAGVEQRGPGGRARAGPLDFASLEALRRRREAWLLAAVSAPLTATFLDRIFIEPDCACCGRPILVDAPEDKLFALRDQRGEHASPKAAPTTSTTGCESSRRGRSGDAGRKIAAPAASVDPLSAFPRDPDTHVAELANGVRVVAVRLDHLETASVSVFVRTGSRHESRRLNGISHFVEHMAFKGTHERDCRQINLDAERLGAEVNAHTDKDHTAYHMRGLARDAGSFVAMLGDIVRNSTFPEAELERERQVILHEYTEDEDDPLSVAYKLFDLLCFGTHPMAQAVIGTRRNIERIARTDLCDYVQRQYSGVNVVVGAAGPIDADAIVRDAERAFGTMPRGAENAIEAPAYFGGLRTRRQPGCSQSHIVFGFPIPSLKEEPDPGIVAAALFGEGMSSPLMQEIREKRALVYYASCSADVMDLCGQFVIEASTAPEHLDEFFVEVTRLLAEHAERIDPVDLERARNQIAVRSLRARERPFRRLEDAAQDLFVHGRVRSRAELMRRIESVSANDVRDAFARMLKQRAAIAAAGHLGSRPLERVLERLALRV